MKTKNLLIVLCLITGLTSQAQTWDGSASTDWNTAANWSTNAVPVATSNVTIPGSLANYPVLATNVFINSIAMETGSQLNFNGFALSLTSVTSYNTFYGCTLNNTIGATDIVININSGTSTYGAYLRNAIVNDNITFNLTGTATFNEADAGGSGNTYLGNVTLNAVGTADVNMSRGGASTYGGNVTITRTGKGITDAFGRGAIIGGNFSFTNNTSGNNLFGSTSYKTSIAGAINISITDTATVTAPGLFQLQRLVNQISGGTINVQNTLGFDATQDTLKITSMSITGYKGSNYGTLYNNDITGNITIVSDASADVYGTYIRSNLITGNASFTNNGDATFNEADAGGSGNTYSGNVTFNAVGDVNMSRGGASTYGGNVIITRTGTGITDAFGRGAIIGGNFSFTNNTSGNNLFGSTSYTTSIAGAINISITDTATVTAPGLFQLQRLINQISGGTINVQNTLGFDATQDTLKITSMSITGYKGSNYGTLYNNDITGNITIVSDASADVYGSYIRSNVITGHSSFTNNGDAIFYDADAGGSGNQYTGNVSIIKNGAGVINIGQGDSTSISQNLTLNSSSGITPGKIIFNGNTEGVIEQLGIQPIIIPQLVMAKTGGASLTLNDSVTITTSAALISGNIYSSPGNKLIFPNNITYTGASATSHVIGPVTKIGDDVFTFPVGSPASYNPVAMSAPTGATSRFSAQYILMNPTDNGYDTSMRAATLQRVSGCEYWDVNREDGASNVTLTFTYAGPCAGDTHYITDPSQLRIAHWTGSTWENLGNGGSTGGTTTGTVTTAGPVTNFSPFTFGSVDIAANPLPLQLTTFKASKQQEAVNLQWITVNEFNFSYFEIERSNGNNYYVSIGRIQAINSIHQYTFSDVAPSNGINFYRLKMVDVNGNFKYSIIQPILFSNFSLISIYPNPARDEIKILSSKNIVSIDITDVSGKLVRRMGVTTDNRYMVNDLQSGMYFIKIKDEERTIISKLLIQ